MAALVYKRFFAWWTMMAWRTDDASAFTDEEAETIDEMVAEYDALSRELLGQLRYLERTSSRLDQELRARRAVHENSGRRRCLECGGAYVSGAWCPFLLGSPHVLDTVEWRNAVAHWAGELWDVLWDRLTPAQQLIRELSKLERSIAAAGATLCDETDLKVADGRLAQIANKLYEQYKLNE